MPVATKLSLPSTVLATAGLLHVLPMAAAGLPAAAPTYISCQTLSLSLASATTRLPPLSSTFAAIRLPLLSTVSAATGLPPDCHKAGTTTIYNGCGWAATSVTYICCHNEVTMRLPPFVALNMARAVTRCFPASIPLFANQKRINSEAFHIPFMSFPCLCRYHCPWHYIRHGSSVYTGKTEFWVT